MAKSKKFIEDEPYVIYWIDPHRGAGWEERAGAEEERLCLCATLCVVLKDHKDRVIVAATTTTETDVLNHIVIPKVCVRDYKKLNVKIWD